MPEIEDCNRKFRNIVGVGTTEKDGNKTRKTRVGKLLQRDKFSTSFGMKREIWLSVPHQVDHSRSLEYHKPS